MVSIKIYNKGDWRGRRKTSAGKARLGKTPQAQDEEAPGPPAESECITFKQRSNCTSRKKTVGKLALLRVCLQSEALLYKGSFCNITVLYFMSNL